jgi:hypothetical protein
LRDSAEFHPLAPNAKISTDLFPKRGTFSAWENVQSTDHTIHTSHRLLTTKNHLLPPTHFKTPFKNTSKNNKTPDRSGVSAIQKKQHKITTKRPS